jgi:uncharacterized membrane protein (UPF0127 family)
MAPHLHLIAAAAALVLGLAATGCSAQASSSEPHPPPSNPGAKKEPERVPVKIAGRTFKLEPALDDATRTKGLGDRTEIAADGGMVFVFTDVQRRSFVMRDCPIPIDILYLDGAGRVLTAHAMVPEPPRGPEEQAPPNNPTGNELYEKRLKRYDSRFPTGLIVELRGGMIKELGVKPGDKLEFDIEGLKKRAK